MEDDAQGKGGKKEEGCFAGEDYSSKGVMSCRSSAGGKLSERSWTSSNSASSNREVTGTQLVNLAR